MKVYANLLRSLEGRSNCSRRHVACILEGVDGRVYQAVNGSWYPLGCERPNEQGNCGCLHAEIRAVALYDWAVPVGTVYLTCAPCAGCAKALVMVSPRQVLFLEESHPMREGFKVLEAAGVRYAQIDANA